MNRIILPVFKNFIMNGSFITRVHIHAHVIMLESDKFNEPYGITVHLKNGSIYIYILIIATNVNSEMQ